MAFELELVVDYGANGVGLDQRYDVLAVRLVGATWGLIERRSFQRVRWPGTLADQEEQQAAADLILALNKKGELGEPNPVILNPFGEWVMETWEDNNGVAFPGMPESLELTNRSRIQINFDSLSDPERNAVLNKQVEVAPLLVDTLNLIKSVSGIDRRPPDQRKTKQGRDAPPNAVLHQGRVITKRDSLAALLAKQPQNPRGQP